ncbi:MAG: pentapeptide repeat-containing protein [Caldilineaceae bacterium]|nr:pentapeptide repeat-containing protein [Caldilineaceae bacterium]
MINSPTTNPHKTLGRTFALFFCCLSGATLFLGAFFVVAAATVELAGLPLGTFTNPQLAGVTAALFLIIALALLLTGRHIWRLWGHEQKPEKAGAQTTVGCLLISSLGCGLWAVLSAVITLLSGLMLMTGATAGWQDVLVASSGFVIAIIVMLLMAGYIQRFHVRLQPTEQEQALTNYVTNIQQKMSDLGIVESKAYVQTQTLALLPQLDANRKRTVIKFLYDLGCLRGAEAIQLNGANLRGVDLQKLELPQLNVQGADLQGANLQQANFGRANFHKANLRKANCSYSNFYQANLWAADLRQATLTGVDFKEANLTAATITLAQQRSVRSLENALMPDSTRYMPQP